MRPLAKMLKDKLSDEELGLVPRSYDLIGSSDKSVAIIEIPEELKGKKGLIAEAIMKMNGNVKSVLNKTSGRRGTFRLEKLELVAGNKNTEVIHREHGYTLKLDPRKVFFSPREATERKRIASQVKPNETVCVFFSGSSPYPISIAKVQPEVSKVYGIEINPDAHHYAEENVRINKLAHKIVLINDDVKKVPNNLKMKFDRIVMPMAVGGEKYLDCAFDLVKNNGIIHFYYTGKEENLFTEAEKILIGKAISNRRKIKVENKVKVLPFAIRSHKVCLDVKIL